MEGEKRIAREGGREGGKGEGGEGGREGIELNLFRHAMTGLHKRLTYTSAPLTHTSIEFKLACTAKRLVKCLPNMGNLPGR